MYIIIIGWILLLLNFGRGIIYYSWLNNLTDMLSSIISTSDKPEFYSPDFKWINYYRAYYPQWKWFQLYELKNLKLYSWFIFNWDDKKFWNQSFITPIVSDFLNSLNKCQKDLVLEFIIDEINKSKKVYVEYDLSASKPSDKYSLWYLWLEDEEGNLRNLPVDLTIIWFVNFSIDKWEAGYKYERTFEYYSQEAKKQKYGIFWNSEKFQKCIQ